MRSAPPGPPGPAGPAERAQGPDGAVEAIRALMVAKRSAAGERTRTINQARALILTGPDDLRARFARHTPAALVAGIASLRPRRGDVAGYAVRVALRELAVPGLISVLGRDLIRPCPHPAQPPGPGHLTEDEPQNRLCRYRTDSEPLPDDRYLMANVRPCTDAVGGRFAPGTPRCRTVSTWGGGEPVNAYIIAMDTVAAAMLSALATGLVIAAQRAPRGPFRAPPARGRLSARPLRSVLAAGILRLPGGACWVSGTRQP